MLRTASFCPRTDGGTVSAELEVLISGSVELRLSVNGQEVTLDPRHRSDARGLRALRDTIQAALMADVGEPSRSGGAR
jgi:hypothetical protein